MANTLTFLGTSTSTGIPVIGCECPRCDAKNTHLHRMRSSIHIQTETQSILVDAGPDLHQQALRAGLKHVDHVLYTHAHLDHVAGFDELRAFCWHRGDRLPLYGSADCMEEIKRMFSWAFCETNTYQGYIRPIAIVVEEPFPIGEHEGELNVTPIPVVHGSVETYGYRFDTPEGKSAVYMCDVKEIPEQSYALIGKPDILIIDCLREQIHVSHMNLTEALEAIEKIQPAQAYLTHTGHELDCDAVAPNLPNNVSFAYDTLQLTF